LTTTMLAFCLHSLLREYGWQFLRRLAAPHPARTAGAIRRAWALDLSGDVVEVPGGSPGGALEGPRSVVGVGFCLKPLDPPCPSGRANHDCRYLEERPPGEADGVPAACRQCAIRELGLLTLKAGAAFYVMTSARDVLFDVFAPVHGAPRFASGLFVLCRYSLRPFAAGLLSSGMRGSLFPFAQGDCRDYRTWLLADRGIKREQTEIGSPSRRTLEEQLRVEAREAPSEARFERRGNVLHPRTARGPAAR
jgi:hypothetical protein